MYIVDVFICWHRNEKPAYSKVGSAHKCVMTMMFGPCFSEMAGFWLWFHALPWSTPFSQWGHLLSKWLFPLHNYWGTFSLAHLYFNPIHTCNIPAWWPISAFILFRSNRWSQLLDGALLVDLVAFLHFPTMPFLGLFTLKFVPQLSKFSLFSSLSQVASLLPAEFWKCLASRRGGTRIRLRERGEKLGYFSHPLASGSISRKNCTFSLIQVPPE